jgi:diaminopimelate epimerase
MNTEICQNARPRQRLCRARRHSQAIELTPAQLRFLADRHFGVGCDQVLLVEPASAAGVDFRYRIFNADGGEVEQCGNGARCFVRFVHEQGLTTQREIRVETMAGSSSRASRTTAR